MTEVPTPEEVRRNIELVATYDAIPVAHQRFLSHLAAFGGFRPRVVYDIGACVLHWTRAAQKVWPDAEYVLFDAFEPAAFLYGGYKHHVGVLSDRDEREVQFYQNDLNLGGNSYYREVGHADAARMYPKDRFLVKKARTLDSVVEERGFPPADLIKIDVQGAELDILRGAARALASARVLIVEMQCVNYNDGAPMVDVTLPFIESLGWRCVARKFSDNGPDADYAFVRAI